MFFVLYGAKSHDLKGDYVFVTNLYTVRSFYPQSSSVGMVNPPHNLSSMHAMNLHLERNKNLSVEKGFHRLTDRILKTPTVFHAEFTDIDERSKPMGLEDTSRIFVR